jgi:hypothetical protein
VTQQFWICWVQKISYTFKIFTLLPLGLCHLGWQHHSPYLSYTTADRCDRNNVKWVMYFQLMLNSMAMISEPFRFSQQWLWRLLHHLQIWQVPPKCSMLSVCIPHLNFWSTCVVFTKFCVAVMPLQVIPVTAYLHITFTQVKPPKLMISIFTSSKSYYHGLRCVVSMLNVCVVNFGLVSIITINFKAKFMV